VVGVKAQKGEPLKMTWAFAGTLLKEPTSTKGVTKGIWTHTIDSRSRHVVVDSGYLKDTIDEDGNSQQLEYGQMMDEEVGKIRDYEEMWEDKRVDQGPMVVMMLGNLDVQEKQEVDDSHKKNESRGMLICLGGCLQMVKRTGQDEIVAEKWTVSWKSGGAGKTECVWCAGDDEKNTIGGKVVQDMCEFEKGQKVTYGMDIWVIVECDFS